MRAFGAARAAQLRVAGRREKRDGALHFDVGIALHFGNAAARWISPHASLTYAVNSAKVCSCRSRSKAASLSMISADSEPSRSGASTNRRRSLLRSSLELGPSPDWSGNLHIRLRILFAHRAPAPNARLQRGGKPMEMEKIHVFARSLLSRHGGRVGGSAESSRLRPARP